MHSFVIKPGSITAAVRSIVLRFTGRTAHASEPEKGENPSLAIADLLQGCARISVNDVTSPGLKSEDSIELIAPPGSGGGARRLVHVRPGAYGDRRAHAGTIPPLSGSASRGASTCP